jgi:hypothetical protein
MYPCNPVAIANMRVAMTAYEGAIGPIVKAWAKSKCARLSHASADSQCTE